MEFKEDDYPVSAVGCLGLNLNFLGFGSQVVLPSSGQKKDETLLVETVYSNPDEGDEKYDEAVVMEKDVIDMFEERTMEESLLDQRSPTSVLPPPPVGEESPLPIEEYRGKPHGEIRPERRSTDGITDNAEEPQRKDNDELTETKDEKEKRPEAEEAILIGSDQKKSCCCVIL